MGDLYVKGELMGNTRCDDALADSDNPVKNSVLNTHLNNNTTLTTTNKSVVGAINELKSEKAGQFTTMPEPSATYANGAIYLYIGVTTTTAPIYTHGKSYECQESTTTTGTYEWVEAGGGGSVSEWGDIGGTLSNQTDLQDALDDKQNKVFYQEDEPTSPVEGDLWVSDASSSSSLMQDIYDMIYPVGKRIIDFSAPVVPTGITATWSASTYFDGRALWVDSTNVGNNVDGSLPKIEGSFDIAVYETGAAIVKGASGAVKCVGGSGSDTTKLTYGSYSTTSTKITFKASDYNSTIYSASAGTNIVRPTAKCVAVYVRTA